jgi:hypothetical protein
MDPFERVVGCGVAAPVISPTINDALVVTVEDKISFSSWSPGDCVYEELKTDSLGPSNVLGALKGLPARDEAPGTPAASKDDADADAGTGIREGGQVTGGNGNGNGSTEEWPGEAIDPPLEVLTNRGWGVSWHERTVTVDTKHGFKPCETGTASWDDKGRV